MTEAAAVQPSLLKTTIAGGFGGACLVLVGHPLDTIKVKIQTMHIVPGQPPPYSGTLDCARKTIATSGIRGLYKGMSAPLYGVTPMYALCFLGYGIGKKIFCDPDAYTELKLGQIALAGATSGVFTTPILAPLERLKCLLQVQEAKPGGKKYSGPWDLGKDIYKEGGIRSINRGYMATMLRDSVASIFYFTTYEYLKRKLTPAGEKGPGTFAVLFAGGMAGIMNWIGCLPIDTLKSRLQVAPEGKYQHGIRSVFLDVIKNEKISVLFRGLGPVMIRAFPANAACFYGYETAIKVLDRIGIE